MTNRSLKNSALILAGIFAFSQFSQAEQINVIPLPGQNNFVSSINPEEVNLNLEGETKHQIEISEPAKEISDNLFTSKEDMLKHYLQAQKKLDIEDIKLLWESTVERNAVIRFALKKLALPADSRRINSSRMAKTVSTLISGAAILPALLGADALTSSAVSTSGTLAGRAIVNKDLPKEMPLTDTELIHLAKLIEDLQDKIIRNYYCYKGNLEAYKLAKEETITYNNMYSKAFDSDNFAQMMTSKVLYDNALKNELELKQKIKLNRLELERLAGGETINSLNLGNAVLVKNLRDSEENSNNDIKTGNKALQGNLACSEIKIHDLADEIAFELKEEKEDLLGDLQILWAAAVAKSETIKFAIIKLSNPDGEKEKKSAIKKILSPIAGVAPLVGLGLGDPVTATGTMFGGSLLTSLMSDDSKINAKFSKVTDADLVLLAQETDSLQEKLVVLYHDYLSAMMELKFADKKAEQNKDYLNIAKELHPDLGCVANVFYKETINEKFKARQNVLNKRIALEQFVGNDALLMIDKNIKRRLAYNF